MLTNKSAVAIGVAALIGAIAVVSWKFHAETGAPSVVSISESDMGIKEDATEYQIKEDATEYQGELPETIDPTDRYSDRVNSTFMQFVRPAIVYKPDFNEPKEPVYVATDDEVENDIDFKKYSPDSGIDESIPVYVNVEAMKAAVPGDVYTMPLPNDFDIYITVKDVKVLFGGDIQWVGEFIDFEGVERSVTFTSGNGYTSIWMGDYTMEAHAGKGWVSKSLDTDESDNPYYEDELN